jgi:predicted ATPase
MVAHPGDLKSIAAAPSVSLFVDRAAARRRGFSLTDENYLTVAEICVRLDGLPLAIELAAAQIGVLSPSAEIARLRADAPFLVGGPRDLPARQQTLESVVEWGYELLSPAEQDIFRWCGVFVGGCTAEAAEAVHTSPDPNRDVLSLLLQLGSKSLVQVMDGDETGGLPRFRRLGTIRSYAVEQLRKRGEWDLARQHHAEYFLGLAERLQPGLRGPNVATTLGELARDTTTFARCSTGRPKPTT